jgi:hypothetical protein
VTIRILYSRKHAAEMLSMSERELDRERAAGKLAPRFKGGRPMYEHDELVAYAKSLPSERP